MPTEALQGLDLEAWLDRFTVQFKPRSVMDVDRAIALHRLTKYGPQLGIGEWEIWIAEDCRDYADYLALHEAVENYLRREGWSYPDSHEAAVEAERRMFGEQDRWQHYMENV